MFKKKKIALGVAVGFMGLAGIMSSAQAVHVNADGTGQVLLFPYYNAQEGYVTNINLINSTDETKAVRIRFREGKTSQDVLDFNLYMSPEDTWTGSISQAGDVAAVTTTDHTCALPALASCKTGQCSVTVPMKFRETSNAPSLRNAPEDTLQGYIEVIEMGVVNDSAVEYGVLHQGGTPNNCGVVADAWYRNTFTTGRGSESLPIDDPDPQVRGLLRPTGGLMGSSAVLNVGEGTAMAVDPVAIDDFTLEPHHTRPDDPENYNLPSLASGTVRTSKVMFKEPGQEHTVQVYTDWFDLDDPDFNPRFFQRPTSGSGTDDGDDSGTGGAYPSLDAPGDPCLANGEPACGTNPFPVAHILLASQVMNEYFLDPTDGYDGHTDWIVTFPMKKYGIFREDYWNLDFESGYDNAAQTRRICENQIDKQYESAYLAPQCTYNGPVHVTFGEEIFDREEGRKRDEHFSPYQSNPRILEREVNVLSFYTSDPSYDSSRTVMSSVDFSAADETSGFHQELDEGDYSDSAFDYQDIVETGPFVSGWARMSFMPWYTLEDGVRPNARASGGPRVGVAYNYETNQVDRIFPATHDLYKGVPVVGFAAIEGNVSANPNARFGDALPHKVTRGDPIDDIRGF